MNKPYYLLATLVVLLCVAACQQKGDTASPSENPVITNILNRKSVRDYTPRAIPETVMRDLLKAGMAAPSSKDRRPWQFVVISDKALLSSLAGKLKTAAALGAANKAIVVCGDTLLSDNCWQLDCSAATQNILLAAESLGLGAVWAAAYPYPEREAILKEALHLPANIRVLAIVPLGYPIGNPTPKDKFDETKIHYNAW